MGPFISLGLVHDTKSFCTEMTSIQLFTPVLTHGQRTAVGFRHIVQEKKLCEPKVIPVLN